MSAKTTTQRTSKAILRHPPQLSAARHIQHGEHMMATLGCSKQVLLQPRWASRGWKVTQALQVGVLCISILVSAWLWVRIARSHDPTLLKAGLFLLVAIPVFGPLLWL